MRRLQRCTRLCEQLLRVVQLTGLSLCLWRRASAVERRLAVTCRLARACRDAARPAEPVALLRRQRWRLRDATHAVERTACALQSLEIAPALPARARTLRQNHAGAAARRLAGGH